MEDWLLFPGKLPNFEKLTSFRSNWPGRFFRSIIRLLVETKMKVAADQSRATGSVGPSGYRPIL